MQWTTLNIFQRLVRRWENLHPYNAAQIVQLAGAADPSRLTDAWQETLFDLGLGPLCVVGDRYRFESLNGDAPQYRVTRVAPDTSLEAFVTAEINRSFEPGEHPLRPFVLDLGDGAHYVGLVYQHWVADSASIRVLLREWFYRTCDPGRARRRRLRAGDAGYWSFFGPGRASWRIDDGLLGSLRWSSRLKRVRRVEHPDFADYRTSFTLHHLPDGTVDALRGAARRLGVTLNDLFLAALAEVCDRHANVQRTPRRQDIALGTIVDLRGRLRGNGTENGNGNGYGNGNGTGAGDMSEVFGLFLGFTSVICRPRDLGDWDRLLRTVAAQNQLHKRNHAPEASMIRMAGGLVVHRMLGDERVRNFYRKRVPLAGGVSNVNLNGTWAQCYHPNPLLNYIRVSPCGPMMPLCVTPTTIGRRLNIGLTCRASVISPEAGQRMIATFLTRLAQVAARIDVSR